MDVSPQDFLPSNCRNNCTLRDFGLNHQEQCINAEALGRMFAQEPEAAGAGQSCEDDSAGMLKK